jgi:transposase-like protein
MMTAMSADSSASRPDPDYAETEGTVAEVLYSVGAVARSLGVAPATLRTWDRRYGLGPSMHLPGTHRRYSVADLRRLKHMRRLTLAGVPAADAARAAVAAPAAESAVGSVVESTIASTVSAGASVGQPTTPPIAMAVNGGRSGGSGGRVLAMPGGDPAQRGLAQAAMALDTGAIAALVGAAIEEQGVVGAWLSLAVPVLVAVGRRWAETGEGVEVEHLLSNSIDSVLRSHLSVAAPPAAGRPVLLTSAPGEQHSLPLSALAAALAERGVGCLLLGSQTPARGLAAAVRRVGPSAAVVWSQLPSTADTGVLTAIPRTRPPTAVFAAGPGWDRDLIPDRATSVTDFASCIMLVRRAVGLDA